MRKRVGVLIAGALFVAGAGVDPAKTSSPSVPVTLVDATCEKSRVENFMVFVRGAIDTASLTTCHTEQAKEAKPFLEKAPSATLPLLFIDPSIDKHPAYAALVQAGKIQPVKGGFLGSESYFSPVSGRYLRGRPRKPGELAVFGMAFCPASQRVERLLLNFRQAQAEPGFTLQLRFLVTETGGSLFSFHGKEELWEDGLQAIIQRDHPERLRDYLLARQDLHAPQAIAVAGLDAAELSAKGGEGLSLLKEDAALAKELRWADGPVFLWENQYVIYLPQGLVWYAPFERLPLLQPLTGGCGPGWGPAQQANGRGGETESPSGGCAGNCAAAQSGVLVP